jgi:signal peptidase I
MAKAKQLSGAIVDFFEMMIIGIGIFVLSIFFLAEPLQVTGDSMNPTLLDKEQIIAEKLTINFSEPHRGDIIVFKNPEKQNILLIKRIVGLPNERLLIDDGKIYINGGLLAETYTKNETYTVGKKTIKEGEEISIPSNSYVVMGDNRENSSDSRDFGPVNEGLLVGKAFLVFNPIENVRLISSR